MAACARAVLKMSKTVNSRGYRIPQIVNAGDCTGCKQCAEMCPDAAIQIEQVVPEASRTPATKSVEAVNPQ